MAHARRPTPGGRRSAASPGRRIALGVVALATLAILADRGYRRFGDRPIDRAVRAYERGDWRGASAGAREILRDDPGHREALTVLARAEARLGRDAIARSLYGRLDPDGLGAEDYFLVGRGLIADGQIESGLQGLERALELRPDHAEVMGELIPIYRRADRLFEAHGLASRLSEQPGREVLGLVLLGLVNQDLADPTAAAGAFREALDRDPDLAGAEGFTPDEVGKRLARCYLQIGEPAGARRALEALLARRPEDPELGWLLSRVALQEHDPEAALAALATAGDHGSDRPEAFEPAPYVGASRCAECHPAIVRAQRGSRHAETFRLRGDLDDVPGLAGPVADPVTPGVTHEVTSEPEGLRFRAETPDGDLEALVQYVMGSGDRAMTFVGRDPEGRWCELRMSYYGPIDDWDRTTGHPALPSSSALGYLGQEQARDSVRRCLGCHTTNARLEPDGSITAHGRGFDCERCHGPAGNHLDAVDLGLDVPAIGQPRLATPVQLNNLCGQCHAATGRDVALDDPDMARFQSTGLPLSRCTTGDLQPLSCLDCHDPHRNAETDDRFYEVRCLECHAPTPGVDPDGHDPPRSMTADDDPGRVPCPVNPTRGCVSCHMPQVETAVPHTTFTDHWIRVHPTGGPGDDPR